MEAILKFNLPEEQVEFQTAVAGVKWKSIVWEYDQKLRSLLKHGELKDGVHDQVEKLREELRGLIEEEGLNFAE